MQPSGHAGRNDPFRPSTGLPARDWFGDVSITPISRPGTSQVIAFALAKPPSGLSECQVFDHADDVGGAIAFTSRPSMLNHRFSDRAHVRRRVATGTVAGMQSGIP
jgi:hypothetical protein